MGCCTTLTLRTLIATQQLHGITLGWILPNNGGTPSTSGWVPIGRSDSAAFTAIFDGNGHTISNLYINSSANYVGLFGYTDVGSEIRNLGLEHGSVTTTGVSQGIYTGGLVGRNQGSISASYATASVTGGRKLC